MDIAQIQKAAKDGHAAHQVYLSRLHLMGAGVPREIDAAMHWLKQAIAQGYASAYGERAAILAQGYAGGIDVPAAWKDLLKAAKLGDAPSQRQVGVFACLYGDEMQGKAFLTMAAKHGDEPAQILLGDLAWEGGDSEAAAYWYARASENPLASWRMRVHALSPPKTTPTSDDLLPPDAWSALAAINPLQPLQPRTEQRHGDPSVMVLAGAIPRLLCRYVMAVGAGLIRESDVVDPETGKSKVDPYRTGFHHQFMSGLCDFTVAMFDHHIAAQTQTRPQQGEPLTLLVYRPGQQYKPHWDHLVDTMAESFSRIGRSGNRDYTALVTLDDQFTGGATRFTRLNIEVRLAPGDMLVFGNLDAHGNRHDDSMHAGMPVEEGVKWLASKWIRQRDYCH